MIPSLALIVNFRVTRQSTVESLESQFTVGVPGQLSVADKSTRAFRLTQVGNVFGLQPKYPPVGQVNVGASQSFTVMSKLHWATGSVTPVWVAVHLTVVVPTG